MERTVVTEGGPVSGTAGPRRAVEVVRARGALDWHTSEEFADALAAAVDTAAGRVVVDMSAVTFADSVALKALVVAQRALGAHGAELVIAGPLVPSVRRLFEVTGTTDHFAFAPTVESATRA